MAYTWLDIIVSALKECKGFLTEWAHQKALLS